MPARAAEAAFPTTGLGQHLRELPIDLRHKADEHLGDPLAVRDLLRLRVEVHKGDADLTPIVAVDRAGRVDDADPPLQGQTRARPDLRLDTLRQGDGEAGRNQL